MEWIEPSKYSDIVLKTCILSIGNYDGLHLGHQQLIKRLVSDSKKMGVPSVVLSFNPHPLSILRPEIQLSYLFSREDLHTQLEQRGIDYFVEVPFTHELSQLSAEDFFNLHLFNKFHPKMLIVGYDFCFGRDRQGDIKFLKKITSENQIQLEVIPAFEWDSLPVSSSRIRRALAEGKLSEVKSMLGRDYYLEGYVVGGRKMGREIGFPTANIQKDSINLANGVYCTTTLIDGLEYSSVTNIGLRPTLGEDHQRVIETHILNKDILLYGKKIRIFFKKHIRSERKFPDILSLKNQILLDIEICSK